MLGAILAVLLTAMAVPVAAQGLSGDLAARQLFPTRGSDLAVSSSLSEQEREIVRGIIREADRTGQRLPYYGSIAYSPSEGLTAESIQGSFNHHSTEAADRAAVAACNAARRAGAARCQIAAHILPRSYEPGRFQLSYGATSAFRSTYRRTRPPKALAISPATGGWKMAHGNDAQDAASTGVALCNEEAASLGGPRDCVAVIVN